MNKTDVYLILILLLFSTTMFSQSSERYRVEEVIVNSYIHGLIDARDFEKAKEGIHEDFLILGHHDTLLTKKTRDEWINQRSKRLNLPDVEYTIVFIDIEGNAASAKIEFIREDITATDYLLLYRFNETWRIVSAIDHVKDDIKE